MVTTYSRVCSNQKGILEWNQVLPKSEEAGSGSHSDMSTCVCSGLENIERIRQEQMWREARGAKMTIGNRSYKVEATCQRKGMLSRERSSVFQSGKQMDPEIGPLCHI